MGKTVVMGQMSDKNDKLLASCLTTLIGIIFVLITTVYIGENLANKCYLSSAIDVHQCQSAEYLAAYDSFVSGQNAEKVQMSDKSVIDLADKLESPESDAFKVQKGEYCVNDDTCSAGARIHAFWTGEIDSTVVDFTDICDSDLVAIMINHISVPESSFVELTQVEGDETTAVKIGGLYGDYQEGYAAGDFTTFNDKHKRDIGQFGVLSVGETTFAIGGTVDQGMIDMNFVCV